MLKGLRPQVELRRETPPCFLPNYDVPEDVNKVNIELKNRTISFFYQTIRNGGDLLALMPNLSDVLSSSNYCLKMRSLLYCEEVAQSIEIEINKITATVLEHIGI